MTCAEGEEWNFTYVLPNSSGEPIQIVVPSALQMGWAESPSFFYAALETARGVAETYTSERVSTLPAHPLEKGTMPPEAAIDERLPQVADMRGNDKITFLQMLEVYVDNVIQLAQMQDPTILRHCTGAVMHGIHSVFPPPEDSGHRGEDLISQKKLRDGEGLWEVRKEIIGWVIEGAAQCIELAKKKRIALLTELKTVLQMNGDVPFKRFQKVVGKLRHAAIGIP